MTLDELGVDGNKEKIHSLEVKDALSRKRVHPPEIEGTVIDDSPLSIMDDQRVAVCPADDRPAPIDNARVIDQKGAAFTLRLEPIPHLHPFFGGEGSERPNQGKGLDGEKSQPATAGCTPFPARHAIAQPLPDGTTEVFDPLAEPQV